MREGEPIPLNLVAAPTMSTPAFSGSDSADARRHRAADDSAHLLFNTTSALEKSNGAVAASLASLYAARALVPAMPWLDSIPPSTPSVTVTGGTIQMTPGPGEPPRWWVVRSESGGA